MRWITGPFIQACRRPSCPEEALHGLSFPFGGTDANTLLYAMR